MYSLILYVCKKTKKKINNIYQGSYISSDCFHLAILFVSSSYI